MRRSLLGSRSLPSLKGLGEQLIHAETTIGCRHPKLALESGGHLEVHRLIGRGSRGWSPNLPLRADEVRG